LEAQPAQATWAVNLMKFSRRLSDIVRSKYSLSLPVATAPFDNLGADSSQATPVHKMNSGIFKKRTVPKLKTTDFN